MDPDSMRQYEIRSHLFVTHGTAYDFGSFQQYEAAVRINVKLNEMYAKRTSIRSSMKTKLAHICISICGPFLHQVGSITGYDIVQMPHEAWQLDVMGQYHSITFSDAKVLNIAYCNGKID